MKRLIAALLIVSFVAGCDSYGDKFESFPISGQQCIKVKWFTRPPSEDGIYCKVEIEVK